MAARKNNPNKFNGNGAIPTPTATAPAKDKSSKPAKSNKPASAKDKAKKPAPVKPRRSPRFLKAAAYYVRPLKATDVLRELVKAGKRDDGVLGMIWQDIWTGVFAPMSWQQAQLLLTTCRNAGLPSTEEFKFLESEEQRKRRLERQRKRRDEDEVAWQAEQDRQALREAKAERERKRDLGHIAYDFAHLRSKQAKAKGSHAGSKKARRAQEEFNAALTKKYAS